MKICLQSPRLSSLSPGLGVVPERGGGKTYCRSAMYNDRAESTTNLTPYSTELLACIFYKFVAVIECISSRKCLKLFRILYNFLSSRWERCVVNFD